MDQGHYNCRDYYISPHFAATTVTSDSADRSPEERQQPSHTLFRHESFKELEQRSRSPASQRPKFPLFALPLELRQHILSYLLPHTQHFQAVSLLSEHARNFSAVKKRAARGMFVPSGNSAATAASTAVSNVVWQRGNTRVFSVCRQLHDECAALVYGTNTFLLFITYAGVTWRYRWLLPSGITPSRSYDFLELMPARYMRLVKKVILHVDHVDSYTGMIKFNVQGKGLTHGLTRQVQRLVNAMREEEEGRGEGEVRRMSKVVIRVSNGNSVIDSIKDNARQQRGNDGGGNIEHKCNIKSINRSPCPACSPPQAQVKVAEDLEEMLEPFADLRGVREVSIGGAITDQFSQKLRETMMSASPLPQEHRVVADEGMSPTTFKGSVQLCVYGNDL